MSWCLWYFKFVLSFVVQALCGNCCIACLCHLNQRYVFKEV
ncbi:MAG TPA: DUF3265 domain-containing protein [Aeromonas salmonicida]|nr:DUF3265 domain-containing protein [Aeromonas salmonicida]